MASKSEDEMDDPKDLDDIPEFLVEAAKAPRKPPEPPKAASPAPSSEKGPIAMTTQTSQAPAKPAPKAKGKTKTARLPVPPPRLRTAISKPTKGSKPAAKVKAKAKPAKVAKAKAGGKRGSKLELIRALLTRPQGCTGADVLKATGWPSFSMNQQAEAMGLLSKLGKEKKPGSPTRYFVKK